MGCSSSKIDDLPAVALCRDRCSFLGDAIHHRHALSQAHLSYLHSLKAVGLSLTHFFDHHHLPNSTAPPLNLPPQTKDANNTNTALHNHHHHHHHHHSHSSSSGSHLHFLDSHSDDSASDSPLHHHSGNDFPSHLNYPDHEQPLSSYRAGDFMGMNMNMNYMKNKATPSLSFEQRPVTAETAYMGESSSSYYPPHENPPSASSYSNYGGGPGINGFFGSPPSYGSSYAAAGPIETAEALNSIKSPPPPPSPPRNSGWDFLNPFESFEKYYHVHTLSRGSKELRDEEGIPDLEDDDFQHEQDEEEVVKEVQVERKFVDSGNYAKGVAEENDSDSLYRIRPDRVSMVNDTGDYEVPMVDKKVVNNEGSLGNVAAFKAQDDSEVVMEIQVQFDRASKSGDEVAKMLEVQTLTHKRNSAYRVSSKMLHAVAPSLAVASSHPSTSEIGVSSIDKADPAFLEIDEEKLIGSANLSSTLQKLHLWEKKLYDEVVAEEKLRVLHDKKALKLKRLDEKGAESHKIDVTRTLVRSLSTRIRIAIQAADKISVKVNKLRDEELWPQLNEFIQGLTRMWKSMIQCHHSQCQAIGQAKRLDAVALQKYLSDSRLEAVLQLEHELLNWTSAFFSWVCAQKGFVQALNSWLLKCLFYVPEVTPDGIVPFSPSRIGAPPVFVICNQWSQAMERLSEKEVVKSMRDFATNVLQLWERDKLEMQQRGMANKDMEKQVKKLEREDQKIQKEIQALDKRMVLVYGDGNGISLSGRAVYQSDTRKTVSLQVSLLRTFEALEGFMENSLRAYDELSKRIEEDRRDRLGRGSEEVS